MAVLKSWMINLSYLDIVVRVEAEAALGALADFIRFRTL